MATVADDALNAQAVNRMLGAGADVAQTFQQTILRHNNEYSALSINASRTFELQSQLLMTNSVKGEPRPAPYGGYGQGGNANPPAVYSVNPTTGAITKG